jgi:hypothetical protein
VLFATATDWVTRLTDAHRQGNLPKELTRLRRYGLIIVDLCRHRNYADLLRPRPVFALVSGHSAGLCGRVCSA